MVQDRHFQMVNNDMVQLMTKAAKSLGVELPMISKAEEVYENAIKGRIRRHRLYRHYRVS